MATEIKISFDTKNLISGLKLLRTEYPEMATNIARELGEAAVKKGRAGIIPKRTGDLRRSTHVEVNKENQSVKFVAGDDTVNYARYVNNGTSRQSPQFYMERSINAASSEFDGIANTALRNWLKSFKN